MNRSVITLGLLCGVFLVPSVALANVGTPLMWATAAHMFLGNACIGVLEGALLSWLFKAIAYRAIPAMILANYVSAWIGWAFLMPLVIGRIEFDLYNAWPRMWGLVAAAYLLTLIFEWPFLMLCLARAPKWFRRSLPACFLVQTASYLLIAGWYWLASGTSLYTRLTVVSPSEMRLPEGVVVYYVSADDGDVYRRALRAGNVERVLTFKSTSVDDCLLLEESKSTRGSWQIAAFRVADGEDAPSTVVASGLADAAVPHYTENQYERHSARGAFWNFGDVPAIGGADENSWQFRSGFWPIAGLRGENRATGENFQFCLETPFVSWHVRHATQLPNGQVVFQFGQRQICIVDRESRRIALLAYGRGPVTVLGSASSNLPSQGRGLQVGSITGRSW
jgi:hypothetical protein